MCEQDVLAGRFEEHRAHLRAVAYRMLGSLGEAEDAVQECWLRLSRTDVGDVENLGGWLTTVVARLCLNGLRARETRREDSLEIRMPDPVLSREGAVEPEDEVLLADSVGLALLVVLEELAPAERLAFVLHDMFSVPFDEISLMLDKTPAATRQLASRARRRVQGRAPAPDPDLSRQRAAVSAFFAATQDGDFEALLALLHPDVVLRSDGGVERAGQSVVLTGARTVGSQAALYSALAPFVRPVLVNGAAGVLCVVGGRLMSMLAFTVTDGLITAIDVLTDPDRLDSIDLGPILDPLVGDRRRG
ncbi:MULTISPECIES: sigma-70 family RNA polymerase sigma factor [unclassified Streptomyces]|uniref:sigma-70 family RNA polymerase sigma factor n=1 Tax=unclassified Streptomyces TaxID=2593676 RepID=UPI000DC7DEC6|nr:MULTISPECIES: sigma-70 family RNA polymerase sigma factor [unclassified Streptomyces]AWZ10930.1 RNA polymerase subunit sigma-70 [Streptomyces sp. ICC4]AWZ18602.1 RNA polymerase subunit sigma-70 [Streptomyces sp. ICC1]